MCLLPALDLNNRHSKTSKLPNLHFATFLRDQHSADIFSPQSNGDPSKTNFSPACFIRGQLPPTLSSKRRRKGSDGRDGDHANEDINAKSEI